MSGEAPPPGPAPARPPASFSLLCASLAAQVQVALGLLPNPVTKKTERDLVAAKHGIDLLDMLASKTKGNLDAAEEGLLGHVLFDLRMAYVEATRGGSRAP